VTGNIVVEVYGLVQQLNPIDITGKNDCKIGNIKKAPEARLQGLLDAIR